MMGLNDNKLDIDAALKRRAAPPNVRADLADDIISAAMARKAPAHNVVWFRRAVQTMKTPRAMMAMAACVVFALVVMGGASFLPTTDNARDGHENYVTAALNIEDIEVDVLYDWEDFYL